VLVQGNGVRSDAESECYAGVQTFMGITENHLAEVQFTKEDLLSYLKPHKDVLISSLFSGHYT
jgi:hypothetical protein